MHSSPEAYSRFKNIHGSSYTAGWSFPHRASLRSFMIWRAKSDDAALRPTRYGSSLAFIAHSRWLCAGAKETSASDGG